MRTWKIVERCGDAWIVVAQIPAPTAQAAALVWIEGRPSAPFRVL